MTYRIRYAHKTNGMETLAFDYASEEIAWLIIEFFKLDPTAVDQPDWYRECMFTVVEHA